jgi:hypothetical protein
LAVVSCLRSFIFCTCSVAGTVLAWWAFLCEGVTIDDFQLTIR